MLAYRLLWGVIRPLLFLSSPQHSHNYAVSLLQKTDTSEPIVSFLEETYRRTFDLEVAPATKIGGVRLSHPLILAAGMVKGIGFDDECKALAEVEAGLNILPGWRSVPALLGPVEFGSFTRWPRRGNQGAVLWRDTKSRSTRNRVGLRNPGARAVAQFLGQQQRDLPACWGINLATSPGEEDVGRLRDELLESLGFFLEAGARPDWFTLNISCPNTGDDPRGRHSAALLRVLCEPATKLADPTPVWIKVAPDLGPEQYRALPQACAGAGVRAIVATNTLAQPAPDNRELQAGLGGAGLFDHARAAQVLLQRELDGLAGTVDLIACGGILDGASWRACRTRAGQYWSALVWRGPLAAALILREGQGEQ